VYDALGRVTATRQPISLGRDAGETRTVYWLFAVEGVAGV
jgi:hypothetical protein